MQTDLVEVKELEQEISPVVAKANEIVITNPQQYEYAASHLTLVKGAIKKVKEYWGPLCDAAHKSWKGLTGKRGEMLSPLEQAEKILKNKQIAYNQEQQRKAAEEQRRLQAEADARAERERQRLLKEAEKLKTPELKEERLRQAEEVEAPVVTVQTEVPKVQGQSFRKTWKAEIVDKKAFVEAALKDDNLLAFLEIDMSKMNKLAAATKGQINYPGIKFFEDTSMASRGQ